MFPEWTACGYRLAVTLKKEDSGNAEDLEGVVGEEIEEVQGRSGCEQISVNERRVHERFGNLTMREGVLRVIEESEEGVSVLEIASALGIKGEEKLVARILQELQKRHPAL